MKKIITILTISLLLFNSASYIVSAEETFSISNENLFNGDEEDKKGINVEENTKDEDINQLENTDNSSLESGEESETLNDTEETTLLEEDTIGMKKNTRVAVIYPATIQSLFEDAALAEIVRVYVQKPSVTSTVVKADLDKVKEISFDSRNVSNLKGIELLSNLEKITATNNKITSIDNVDWSALPALKVLDLNQNLIRDISTVNWSGLSALNYLNLGNNEITDISNVNWEGLPLLKTLFLHNNGFSKLDNTTWNKLTELTTLQLESNNISDISTMKWEDLSKLESLTLNGNQLTTLENDSWGSLTELTYLSMLNNKITDISGIAWNKLTKLEHVSFHNNHITSISNVDWSGSTSMVTLILSQNRINSLAGVNWTGLTNLKVLNLRINEISDVKLVNWSGLNSLERLYMLDNRVYDISGINWTLYSPNLIEVNLSQQNATAPNAPYADNLVLKNAVLSPNGNFVPILSVSDGGTYDSTTGENSWNFPSYVPEVSYEWNTSYRFSNVYPNRGIFFGGKVTVPLKQYRELTFKDWDERLIKKEQILEGNLIEAPENPTRENYVFTGWTPNLARVMGTEDLIYTATYEKISSSSYVIEFHGNGGSVNLQRGVTNTEGKLESLPVPTYTNYSFKGWYTAATGGERVTTTYKFTANSIIYAQWTYVGGGGNNNGSNSGNNNNNDGSNNNQSDSFRFEDVLENDWFYDNVHYIVRKGLMVGTDNNRFSPNMPITRGMIATIIYRMEGEPTVSSGNTFDDVATGQYYTNGVTWTVANGIAAGYGNNKFGPDDSITREQMVSIIYHYLNYKGYDLSSSESYNIFASYNDISEISGYATHTMRYALAKGIIVGKQNRMLDPKGITTRAEAATILRNLYEKIMN